MFLYFLKPLLFTEIIVTTVLLDQCCQFFHIGFYNVIHSFSHIFKITDKEELHDSWVNGQVTVYFCNSAYAPNFTFMNSRQKQCAQELIK
jgi:hypothetical protein